MNLTVLKTPAFWAAAVAALIGVSLSQHVFLEGSTVAGALGWIMTFIGPGVAGHQIAAASASQASASQQTTPAG
jgi:hypothetical protein